MVVFDVSVSGFSGVCLALSDASGALSGESDVARARAVGALAGSSGGWSEGAGRGFASLSAGLEVVSGSLSDVVSACGAASDDLAGLASKRGAVAGVVGGLLSDADRVCCDAGVGVDGAADAVLGSLSGLSAAAGVAVSACAGLDDACGEASRVRAALGALADAVGPLGAQRVTVSGVRAAWDGYAGAVSGFDSDYGARFAGAVVTAGDVDKARGDVLEMGIKEASRFRDAKKARKALSDVQKLVKADLDLNVIRYSGERELFEAADRDISVILSKPVSEIGKADFDGIKRLGSRVYHWSDFDEYVTGQAAGDWDYYRHVVEAGKALKYGGWALNMAGTADDAMHAYQLAGGDTEDRVAAGETAAVEDGISIGAGSLATWAVGMAVGGPVGAVVGIAAGAVVSFGLDKFEKTDVYRQGKTAVKGWFSEMNHDISHFFDGKGEGNEK